MPGTTPSTSLRYDLAHLEHGPASQARKTAAELPLRILASVRVVCVGWVGRLDRKGPGKPHGANAELRKGSANGCREQL